jgi:hypothetical protein
MSPINSISQLISISQLLLTIHPSTAGQNCPGTHLPYHPDLHVIGTLKRKAAEEELQASTAKKRKALEKLRFATAKADAAERDLHVSGAFCASKYNVFIGHITQVCQLQKHQPLWQS